MKDAAPPLSIKAGAQLVPFCDVKHLDLTDLEGGRVRIVMKDGTLHDAMGFDAIEAVMALKPSAVEGLRLKWKPHAWAFHNLIAHPCVQLLAWCGWKRAAVRFHDWTTPMPREFRATKKDREMQEQADTSTSSALLNWNPMSSAPRDGFPVLLFHATKGVVEGIFVPSHWPDGNPEIPAEFEGAVWLIGDDQSEEIEVEEYGPDAPEPYHDGPLKGWLPRSLLPLSPDLAAEG